MRTLFFTGFPGFLGSELLPRILARERLAQAACLVQPKFAELARRRARELESVQPDLAGRVCILEGDITAAGLGLGQPTGLRESVAEIYHLAAIYDLSVARDLAMRINVEGTRNVLDFAAECPALQRFQYVSTCYVSGRHPGLFSEQDLDCGQRFYNFYEETKFLAEVEVQQRMRQGLPATIYRPAIVVGDSRTGTTQKYDGPYSVIRLLLRQPRLALLPTVGNPRATQVNVVPRDFVLNSIAWLSGVAESNRQVYHLADPDPLTVGKMLEELARATKRAVIRMRLPLGLARLSLQHVPGMDWLIGIPPAALDYFVHPGRYATAQTQAALKPSGIRCPRFPEYAARLVAFVMAHPEIGSAAMA